MGAIGAVFGIMTWFVAIGAVIILGAVVGVVWEDRRSLAAVTAAGAMGPAPSDGR